MKDAFCRVEAIINRCGHNLQMSGSIIMIIKVYANSNQLFQDLATPTFKHVENGGMEVIVFSS